jgi:transcriptional regulator with XRE-family HTH domain
MSSETLYPTGMHIGRKISRIRELRGMKQETLAHELGVTQQAISKLEQSEDIDDEKLELIATALGVSAEGIKSFNEEAVINNINTFRDSSSMNDYSAILNYQCQFNPVDKLLEALEENKRLYEQLLSSEREKVEMLQKILQERNSG